MKKSNFLRDIKKNKFKSIIIFSFLLFIILFIGAWNVVSGGHDKQNKVVLFFKDIIPTPIFIYCNNFS